MFPFIFVVFVVKDYGLQIWFVWYFLVSLSQRNRFPPDCESYVKIKELMALSDPLEVNIPESTEEQEGQGA